MIVISVSLDHHHHDTYDNDGRVSRRHRGEVEIICRPKKFCKEGGSLWPYPDVRSVYLPQHLMADRGKPLQTLEDRQRICSSQRQLLHGWVVTSRGAVKRNFRVPTPARKHAAARTAAVVRLLAGFLHRGCLPHKLASQTCCMYRTQSRNTRQPLRSSLCPSPRPPLKEGLWSGLTQIGTGLTSLTTLSLASEERSCWLRGRAYSKYTW